MTLLFLAKDQRHSLFLRQINESPCLGDISVVEITIDVVVGEKKLTFFDISYP
jgi:hypothetical protein